MRMNKYRLSAWRICFPVLALLAATPRPLPAQPAQVSAPYPPSQMTLRIVWAPKETIIRKAHDSDNWPMTWADDDAL